MTWRENNLTATAKLNLENASGNDIYTLIIFAYPSGGDPKYYSDRSVTVGGVEFSPRLLGFPVVNNQHRVAYEQLGFNESFPQPTCMVDIDDSSRHGTARLKALFFINNPEGCIVTIYTWIKGNGAGLEDMVDYSTYVIKSWSEPEPYVIRLEMCSLLEYRGSQNIGRVIQKPEVNLSNYSCTDIPSETQGKIIPVAFGKCQNVPLLAYNSGVTSYLAAALPADYGVGDLIPILDSDGRKFPASGGKVQIGTEVISFDEVLTETVDYDALKISERVSPEYHADGCLVSQVPVYRLSGASSDTYGWVYLVADHQIVDQSDPDPKLRGVSNVRVNDRQVLSTLYSLKNYDDESPVIYNSQNVAALIFSSLPRISSGENNITNSLTLNGFNYPDSWSEGDLNTASYPLNAFSEDPSLPSIIEASSERYCRLCATASIDLSDGQNRYGYIKRVLMKALYASDRSFTNSDTCNVVMTMYKNGEVLIPQPQPTAHHLPSPQSRDFDIVIPPHTHDINTNTTGSNGEPTTNLFLKKETETPTITNWQGMQGWDGNPPFSYVGWTSSHPISWLPSPILNLSTFINTSNMIDSNEGSFGIARRFSSESSGFPGGVFDNVDYWVGEKSLRFVPQRPSGSSPYVLMGIRIKGGNYFLATGFSDHSEITVNIVVPGVGSKSQTIGLSWDTWKYVTYSGNFTQAELDNSYITIDLNITRDTYKNTMAIREIQVGYCADPASADLWGSSIPVVSESEAVYQELAGVKLSNRMLKTIDITSYLNSWAESNDTDMWKYFSSDEGGYPEFHVYMINQDEGTVVTVYDAYFEIEYEPIISFGEETVVTADVNGLVNAGGTLLENPANIIKVLIEGDSERGIRGLDMSAYVDSTSFSTVGSQLSALGYAFGRYITNALTHLEALHQLKRESRTEIGYELSKYILILLPEAYQTSANVITTADILNDAMEFTRSDSSQLANRIHLYYNENLLASSLSSERSEIFRNVITGEDIASQNEAWGLQEAIIEAYWHNNDSGGGGTANLLKYLISNKAHKLIKGYLDINLIGLSYGLGDILKVTNEYADLNSTPCMLIGRERTSQDRLRLMIAIQQMGTEIIWQDEYFTTNKIVPSVGHGFFYFIIGGVIAAMIDMNGNLYLSGGVWSYGEIGGDYTDEPIFSGPASKCEKHIHFCWFNEALELPNQYQAECVISTDTGVGLLRCATLYTKADLSGETMTGGGYYEADADGFRMSLNGTDVVFAVYPDKSTKIAGRVFPNYNF